MKTGLIAAMTAVCAFADPTYILLIADPATSATTTTSTTTTPSTTTSTTAAKPTTTTDTAVNGLPVAGYSLDGSYYVNDGRFYFTTNLKVPNPTTSTAQIYQTWL
jgi:hypothetical protein